MRCFQVDRDVTTGETVVILAEHSSAVCALEVVDESELLTSSWDYTARLWSIEQLPGRLSVATKEEKSVG